jgi:transcription-repair coupling factor (superfamily II helicase)
LLDRFGRLPESAKNLMHITKLRTSFTETSVTSVSVIGSELKIILSDFMPFSSVQKLISSVEEKMIINNFNHHFSQSATGFKISVNADNLKHSLKALELFVGLFSK